MPEVFKYEIRDGLKDNIMSDLSVAFYLEPNKIDILNNEELIKLSFAAVDEYYQQFDPSQLYYFESVLTSTGWNKNDDIFDRAELWNAKASPINKKINYMHDEEDIIGHMTRSFILDNSSKSVSFESTIDNVPADFNLCVGGVLYKVWEKAELQLRMDNLLADISKAKWKVSMECLFAGFDYGLITPTGEHKIIKRTQETAFLTKYLRRYGGKGEFEGHKIGRVLRNIAFSGKGIVDNPANPKSIILSTDNSNFQGVAASINIFPKEERKMEYTKEMYDKLERELETAKAALKDASEKTVNRELEALKANIAILDTAKAKAQTELDASKAVIQAHEAKVKTLEVELATANEKLAKANETIAKSEKESLKAKRLAMFSDVEIESVKAQELVDKFADASDAMFDELVKAMPKKNKTVVATPATPAAALAAAVVEPTVATVPAAGASDNLAKASAWFASFSTSNKTENTGE